MSRRSPAATGAPTLREDGTVWAWGSGATGRLGNGATNDSVVPVRVAGLTGVTAVAAGFDNGYAVRADGTVWAWGGGNSGKLGDGVECVPNPATCEARVPVRVSALTEVTQIASFDYGGYALRADGTMWAWGSNLAQSLGNDRVSGYSSVPVPVNGIAGVSAIGGEMGSGYAVVP